MTFKTMMTGLLSAFVAAPALAQDLPVVGRPHQGGMGFQPASTELARDLQWLDGMILVIITAICLLVVALLAFIVVRYNQKANKTPGTFTLIQGPSPVDTPPAYAAWASWQSAPFSESRH